VQPDVLSALRVFSLSHHSCGLTALGAIVSHGDASRLHATLVGAGVESTVLSTCNRFEVYWRAVRSIDDQLVAATIEAGLPLATDLVRDGSLQLSGEDAAHHLFRVCSGLESMVLGEAEILGQARSAMEAAGTSAFLRGVFTAAIRTGRSARAETGIGIGAMSVASAAIDQIAKCVPPSKSRVLIVGAGETAAKAARHLAKIGVGELVIANRTPDRAEQLGRTYGGRGASLDDLDSEVAAADVVICAALSSHYLITRAHVADRRKGLVVVDLSMPPVVEPFDAELVTRIDLQGVERATATHRARREAEIPAVEAIIVRELEWLRAWARQEMLRPFVSTLRQKADIIRRDELERARQELGSDDPQRVLERFSRRVFDRLLAVPLEQLKSGDVPFDGPSAEYLRRLFALDETRSLALRSSKSEGGS